MRQLKTGKSPGLDGVPVEFYRAFGIASKTTLFKLLMKSTSQDFCHQVKEWVLLDYLQGQRSRELFELEAYQSFDYGL